MANVEDLKDNYRGCLVGVAVGDSLGLPVESMSKQRIIVKHKGVPVRDFMDPDPMETLCPHLKAGQYTDDTQLTMAIARSIIEKKGIDYEDIARKHVETFDKNIAEEVSLRGWGGSTIKGVMKLKKGTPWNASGTIEGAGNGVAMKISPLGLYASKNLSVAQIAEHAKNISLMTHNDGRAKVSGLIQAYAICHLIDCSLRGHFSKEDMLNDLIRLSEKYEGKFGDRHHVISTNLKLIPRIESVDQAIEIIGVGCYVPQSLPFSLYMFYRDPLNFEETLIDTVNAGGDTDSNGSIVASLLGALNGYKSIPERFRKVEDHDKLIELADQLFELSSY